MSANRSAMVAAARAAIGTRTRVQGRVPGLALDCIGLAAVAARAGGGQFDIPSDYSLHGDNRLRLAEGLASSGFERVAKAAAVAGDILQIEVAPGHHHLAVKTGRGAVHADFGIGRVVEAELPPEWRMIAVWRLPAQEKGRETDG